MTVIACVSNDMGLLFGGKRQSRDKAVFEDIKTYCPHLTITPFSEKLLSGYGLEYSVKEKPQKGDVFFLENLSAKDLVGVSKVILYRWNRDYPSEFFFDLDLTDLGHVSTLEFQGNSHDKITREIYEV